MAAVTLNLTADVVELTRDICDIESVSGNEKELADAIETAGMRPDVNFAMAAMHMDGVTPPLALVEAGVWRADVKLPMAGRWVVSVGFGEEFAEVEFDAR